MAATRRILDLQDGPTLLVGHSYGGSVVTEAGVHSKVVGLVYVAAHAPDVGEDEGTLGKRIPSVLARTPGASPGRRTVHLPQPSAFPKLFAPDLPRQQAEFEASSQVPAAAEVFTTPLTPPRGGPSRAGESSPAVTRSSIRTSSASTTSGPAAI